MIGVSKRCCPICRSLLFLLANDEEQPFLVKGSHSMVTACTLPPWLPSDIVDKMNQIFGGQLNLELIKLCKSPLMQNHSSSTGSWRISSDIGHGVGGINTAPFYQIILKGRMWPTFKRFFFDKFLRSPISYPRTASLLLHKMRFVHVSFACIHICVLVQYIYVRPIPLS